MRATLQGDTSAGNFSKMLLQVGEGALPANSEGQVSIPTGCGNVIEKPQDLLQKVYPNLAQHFRDHDWLCERAILAPKNDTVDLINSKILQPLPGPLKSYKSIDTVADQDDAVHYPTEFLNSLQPPGMPPHNLMLKEGAPIMLLRNLDAPRLCNGTRLVVKSLMPHVIQATIITGCAKGEDTFIPRIPLIPSDMPFSFKRLQFPLRLAFAMTINKAQGQSLKVAGIDLTTPCFSHGQLYVACSRVGTSRNLFILAPGKKTNNVVYRSALQ